MHQLQSICLFFFSHQFRMNGNEGPSGFGFELTFRLKREQGETNPPTWPATLMQALSRYVFQTGNLIFCHFRIPKILGNNTNMFRSKVDTKRCVW